MTIGKINNVNKIYNSNSTNKTGKIKNSKIIDKIDISEKALRKAELAKYREIVKNAPDIREDKVEQAKLNLKKYMENNQLLENVIDKIADILVK